MKSPDMYNEYMDLSGHETPRLDVLADHLDSGDLTNVARAVEDAINSPLTPEAEALEAVGMRVGIIGALEKGVSSLDSLREDFPAHIGDNGGLPEPAKSPDHYADNIKETIAGFNSSIRDVTVPGADNDERRKLVLEDFGKYLNMYESAEDKASKARLVASQLRAQGHGGVSIEWMQKNALLTADMVTEHLWEGVAELREFGVDVREPGVDKDELREALIAAVDYEFQEAGGVIQTGLDYFQNNTENNQIDALQ